MGKNKMYVVISVLALIVIIGGLWKIGQNKAAEEARAKAQVEQEMQAKQAEKEAATKQKAAKQSQKESYVKLLLGFEDRMKALADRINTGERSTTIVPVCNVLKNDINSEMGKMKKASATDEEREVLKLLDIQWKRVDCMLRGVRGNANAFAEGGSYYDEFYEKLNKFKANK